jgi:phospho-N-acetylmuramoyl-pentapeptide-transferase
MKKSGTPTPGGVAFIAAAVLAFLGLSFYSGWRAENALLLLFALLCGGIGLVDDWCKLTRGKNQGLTAPQKYALQLLASGIFMAAVRLFCGLDTTLHLPFLNGEPAIGIFYYPLALLLPSVPP